MGLLWVLSGSPVRSANSKVTKRWQTGLEPATFSRVTIRRLLFPGVAVRCRIRLRKPIYLLTIAQFIWVLRAEWCQRWRQHLIICRALRRVVLSR